VARIEEDGLPRNTGGRARRIENCSAADYRRRYAGESQNIAS
jgi:hypothetical protein